VKPPPHVWLDQEIVSGHPPQPPAHLSQITVTFDALFVAEYQPMVALAAAVSGSRVHAEDIAQEAMSRLNRDWEKVQHYAKPGAWLRRVTINLALSQRRRRVSEMKALLRLDQPESHMPEVPESDRDLWDLVSQLPKKQRAAISLHYLEDLAPTEISEILDIAPATVRVHLHRARQQLRKGLQARGRTSAHTPEEAR